MIKVLITGIAGFIGSHLSDACLAKGWQVYGIDNLYTEVPPSELAYFPGFWFW